MLVARVESSRLRRQYRERYGHSAPGTAEITGEAEAIGAWQAENAGQMVGGIVDVALAELQDIRTGQGMSKDQYDLFKRIGYAENRVPGFKALVLGAALMWGSLAVFQFFAEAVMR